MGGGGRTIDRGSGRLLPEEGAKLAGRLSDHGFLRAREDKADQASKRGEVPLSARVELLLSEGQEILIQGRLDAVVIGVVRLDDGLPRQRTPSGPACHLHEQRKGALSRSEVGEVESNVGQEHSDEGDVRVVVPFGDHLRPHQDVYVPTF